MKTLLKRIAINGGLAALVLAIIGLVYAQLAVNWLANVQPGRPGGNAPESRMKDIDPEGTLQTQVPLGMAFWGFVAVSLIEVVRHVLQGVKKEPVKAPPPDDAEKLLNELLQQVEAAEKAKPMANGAKADAPTEPETKPAG